MTETAGRRRARWALILFYAAAGVMHLIVTAAMVSIVPRWVPEPRLVVIATGLCEIAGALGLIVPRLRVLAGWAFAAYAICVFPANINHAVLDLAGHHGLGWGYHAPRLLLQPVIVWWALWASGAIDWPWRSTMTRA